MYNIELKIKAKILAEESKITRREENKALGLARIHNVADTRDGCIEIIEKNRRDKVSEHYDEMEKLPFNTNSEKADYDHECCDVINSYFDKLIKSVRKNVKLVRVINYGTFSALHKHRTDVVRSEARYTHIIRAFLSGKDYKIIEANTRKYINIARCKTMIKKYGDESMGQTFKNFRYWLENT